MQYFPAAGLQIMDVETTFETPPRVFFLKMKQELGNEHYQSDIFMQDDEACFRLHSQKASDVVT